MDVLDGVRGVLRDSLELGERADRFDASTPLFGSLPELDSMAVVSVLLALEERFGITIDGDEVSTEIFETVGNLSRFVERKLAR